ncbi:hypothetical protein [Shewanella sp.]|uniref:hypothetical protein n=1 Tax=Shewanella sp. TaxID=50422 RepID=UPI00404756B3
MNFTIKNLTRSKNIVTAEKISLALISTMILFSTLNWLNLEEFATLALINATILFGTLTTAGPIAQSLNRFIPRFKKITPSFNSLRLLKTFERRALRWAIFTFPIPILIWYFSSPEPLLFTNFKELLTILVAFITRILFQIRYRFFHALKNHKRASILSVGEASVRLTIVVLLAINNSFDLMSYIATYIFSHLTLLFLTRIPTQNNHAPKKMNEKTIRILAKYSYFLLPICIFQWAGMNGFRFPMEYFGSESDLATFAFLQQLFYQPLTFITSIFLTVKAPIFFETRRERTDSFLFSYRSVNVVALLIINSLGVIFIISPIDVVIGISEKITLYPDILIMMILSCVNISLCQFRVIDLMKSLNLNRILQINSLSLAIGIAIVLMLKDFYGSSAIYYGLWITSVCNVLCYEFLGGLDRG